MAEKTPPQPGPVLVALSGGVDSAVAVHLLRRQGYTPQGLVIQFSPAHLPAVEAAKRAAEELQMPLTVCQAEALFHRQVVLPFCRAYSQGTTPNPCVVCNPQVKFHLLCSQADRLGIHFVATGHYARVACENGRCYAACAASQARDQSYMLYRLPQAILGRLLLPLGGLEKQSIRSIASSLGLSCQDSPDSQEICFIPDGDYPAFIARQGFENKPGRFIAPDGTVLASHQGVTHYTVGQRKGLGLALGRPVFVQSILPGGDIQLAYSEQLNTASISIDDIFTPDGAPLEDGGTYMVKIRSMAKAVPCRFRQQGGGGQIDFDAPQRAPAPGQHAVLYKDGLVVGGGVIRVFSSPQPEYDIL